MLRARFTALLFTSVLLTSACGHLLPQAKTPEGSFLFGLDASERIARPNLSALVLPPRSTVTLVSYEVANLEGGGEFLRYEDVSQVAINSVFGNDDDVVVAQVEDGRITLRGVRPGATTITVETAGKGTRTLSVQVAEPARITIVHPLAAALHEKAVYLKGGLTRMRIDRRDSTDRLLAGKTAGLPVHVTPPGGARLMQDTDDVGLIDVELLTEGKFALHPLGGRPWPLEVVDADSIDNVELLRFDGRAQVEPMAALTAGNRQSVVLVARNREDKVVFGTIGTLSLTSTTPEVCTVESLEKWQGDGAFAVNTKAVGDCTLATSGLPQQQTFDLQVLSAVDAAAVIRGEREVSESDETASDTAGNNDEDADGSRETEPTAEGTSTSVTTGRATTKEPPKATGQE